MLSGSVALLGDTLHNAADALTAVPLAIAFTLGRRAATRRYTYGYGRAEDIAGLAVVLLIALSSALAGYEAVQRLLDPSDVDRLGLVAAAGFIGFLGNELVAQYRIRVGREIGSAALVADGLHARTDGLTSLAVVIGAIGVALGFELADPIIGLVITVAILGVLRQAAREVFARLMDAVDPEVLESVERTLAATPGVESVGDVKVRWIGHALRAECEVLVDERLSVVQGHAIAHDAEDRLLRDVRRLTTTIVHAGPVAGHAGRSEPGEHLAVGVLVAGVRDRVDDLVLHDALAVEDERPAQREAEVLLQHAVGAGDVAVRPEVGQQREGVALLVGPLLVHRRAVDRDRQRLHVVAAEVGDRVADRAQLALAGAGEGSG